MVKIKLCIYRNIFAKQYSRTCNSINHWERKQIYPWKEKGRRERGWKISIWSIKTELPWVLCFPLTLKWELGRMSTYTSQREFSEFVIYSKLCKSIFTSENVIQPEQLQAKTPISVCLSIQWRRHIFQNTREPHFQLHVRQLSCEEGGLPLINHTKPLLCFAGACVLAERNFLSLMCAIIGLMFIW